jgi:hypothetical protein
MANTPRRRDGGGFGHLSSTCPSLHHTLQGKEKLLQQLTQWWKKMLKKSHQEGSEQYYHDSQMPCRLTVCMFCFELQHE